MEFLKKVSTVGIALVLVFKKSFTCHSVQSIYILMLTYINMRTVAVDASEVIFVVAAALCSAI